MRYARHGLGFHDDGEGSEPTIVSLPETFPHRKGARALVPDSRVHSSNQPRKKAMCVVRLKFFILVCVFGGVTFEGKPCFDQIIGSGPLGGINRVVRDDLDPTEYHHTVSVWGCFSREAMLYLQGPGREQKIFDENRQVSDLHPQVFGNFHLEQTPPSFQAGPPCYLRTEFICEGKQGIESSGLARLLSPSTANARR